MLGNMDVTLESLVAGGGDRPARGGRRPRVRGLLRLRRPGPRAARPAPAGPPLRADRRPGHPDGAARGRGPRRAARGRGTARPRRRAGRPGRAGAAAGGGLARPRRGRRRHARAARALPAREGGARESPLRARAGPGGVRCRRRRRRRCGAGRGRRRLRDATPGSRWRSTRRRWRSAWPCPPWAWRRSRACRAARTPPLPVRRRLEGEVADPVLRCEWPALPLPRGAGRGAAGGSTCRWSPASSWSSAGARARASPPCCAPACGLVPHFHGGSVEGELEVAGLDVRVARARRAGGGGRARRPGARDPGGQHHRPRRARAAAGAPRGAARRSAPAPSRRSRWPSGSTDLLDADDGHPLRRRAAARRAWRRPRHPARGWSCWTSPPRSSTPWPATS